VLDELAVERPDEMTWHWLAGRLRRW